MLCLESERGAVVVCLALLACHGSVEEVAAIELNARFGGEHLHDASALGFVDHGCQFGLGCLSLVEHPVVVVAAAVAELLKLFLCVVVLDALADGNRSAEVHRCSLYVGNLSGGDEGSVYWSIFRCFNLQLMVVDGALACSVEVEERVVSQVQDGLLVGLGVVGDDELVVVGQFIGHGHVECAGITHLSVNRFIGQHELLRAFLYGIPYHHVEALVAAVQRVGTVVHGNSVFHAVESELAFGNAVAIASDGCSEEALALVVDVGVDVIVAEHDVGEVTVTVGSEELDHAATEVGHGHLQTIGVFQGVEVNLLAVNLGLEIGLLYLRQAWGVFC